ncbi:MAG: pyridoxamine 5'-phosphate oxidase family protein, partial [Chitinophagaceae bacterium]
MFKSMDETQMDDLLSKQVIGRIGCYNGETVYVVPASYVYADNCIYVHSLEGLKLSIMRSHPSVCFQVDDTRNLSNWGSVIAWGVFEELVEEADKQKAMQKLNARKVPAITSETMHRPRSPAAKP